MIRAARELEDLLDRGSVRALHQPTSGSDLTIEPASRRASIASAIETIVCLCGIGVGVRGDDRQPGRPARAAWVERHLAEQRDLELQRGRLAATVAEDLAGHVLDDAEQAHVRLARHGRRARQATSCASFCGGVTTTTSRARQQHARARSRRLRARRQVDDENVMSPQCTSVSARVLCSIGPRQITGSLLSRKNPIDRELQVAFYRRDDHLVDDDGLLVDPEHVRDRMPVDVRVEHAGAAPGCEEGDGGFAVSGDMPTPPLLDAMAITRQSRGRRITLSRSGAPPRSFVVGFWRSSGVITPKEREAPDAGGDGSQRLVDLPLEGVLAGAARRSLGRS